MIHILGQVQWAEDNRPDGVLPVKQQRGGRTRDRLLIRWPAADREARFQLDIGRGNLGSGGLLGWRVLPALP